MAKMTRDQVKEILLHGTKQEIKNIRDYIHPADILDLLHEDEDNMKVMLSHLPNDYIAAIIEEEDEEEQYEILRLFLDDQQKEILDEMSDDEIADLVGELDEEEKEDVLKNLDQKEKKHIENLLQYHPDTAGGIMTTEYVSIRARNTILKTLNYLQTVEQDTKYYLYVVDRSNILKGVVSLRDIVTHPLDTNILEITNPHVKTIRIDEDQETVANKFRKYGFIMMPVVDENNKMLGIIEFDDVYDVMEEETTEDINLLAGVNSEERVDSSIFDSFKSRIPWLVVNLLTAVLAASVINMFEGTVAQVVSLATVMTIVTGMGGNAGTQSLTVLVRGLSLQEIDKENAMYVLLKEIMVGAMSGIVIGILVGIGSWIFAGNWFFGVIAAIAMFLNMVLANCAGYFVPVVLDKLRIDPALASGVFVTTVTDVLGFFFFLGLASLFIQYLV